METARKNRIRRKLFDAQSGRCHLCGVLMLFEAHQHDPLFATMDHLTPKSKGGRTSAVDNFALAHRRCNMERGSRPVHECRKGYGA